jgi:hypothetical protein
MAGILLLPSIRRQTRSVSAARKLAFSCFARISPPGFFVSLVSRAACRRGPAEKPLRRARQCGQGAAFRTCRPERVAREIRQLGRRGGLFAHCAAGAEDALQSRLDPPDVARSNCAAASGGFVRWSRLARATATGARRSRAKRAPGCGVVRIETSKIPSPPSGNPPPTTTLRLPQPTPRLQKDGMGRGRFPETRRASQASRRLTP